MAAKRLFFAVLIAVLVASALPLSVTAQEENWLPAPSGPHQIGTTIFDWVDETRDETFTDNPDDKRELIVQIWYPAVVDSEATLATYLPNGAIEAAYFDDSFRSQGIETSPLGEELSRMPTHSYLDVPVSDEQPRYPVLIYSPGLPGMPAFETVKIEELASHGYVVAAINYPYVSGWTVFSDGRVVTTLPESTFTMSMAQVTSVEIGAQDQIFVLDQLALLNEPSANSPFSGRLDLERVGTFGASWGSWVTLQTSFLDSRFKATLIEEDHSFAPAAIIKNGLDVPIMFMDPGYDSSSSILESMRGSAYKLAMRDISGRGLSDFLLWPGFRDRLRAPDRGNIEPARATQIVNAYSLAFFDRYLNDMEEPLLDGPSTDYPEVEIEARSTGCG
jgi:dienelactone hydrolase